MWLTHFPWISRMEIVHNGQQEEMISSRRDKDFLYKEGLYLCQESL